MEKKNSLSAFYLNLLLIEIFIVMTWTSAFVEQKREAQTYYIYHLKTVKDLKQWFHGGVPTKSLPLVIF